MKATDREKMLRLRNLKSAAERKLAADNRARKREEKARAGSEFGSW